jgi:uncharacterized protein (DUF58 family)
MAVSATARSLRFLDPRVLTRIANLQLAARTVVDGFLAGLHRSPQHGFSPNFAEYRAYTPGDDLRSIDWNVFARSDKYFIKKFEGETNTRIYVALDVSKSMGYASAGTGITKLEYGSILAASLVYFALKQRDLAGLALFDTDITEMIPPRLRRGQLMYCLGALDGIQPDLIKSGRPTDLCQSLETLAGFVRQRSVVAVISDFYEDPEKIARSLRRLQVGRNDLMVFHVLDPNERRPQLRDAALLEDLETGSQLEVAPSYVRGEYLDRLTAHLKGIQDACNDSHIDYRILTTTDPLDEALFAYLSMRERTGGTARRNLPGGGR